MRDSTPGRMIQQQMYARERRGIFRSTEGYDTIAKSKGLDNNFIKKQLHPFCVYDAPSELAVRGEKEDAAYPETMHLLHLENGDILLGRSVYRSADFTGLRSAFFTHNYILPGSEPHRSPSDYKTWLRASFAESYDIHDGTDLSELASLPVQTIIPVVDHRSLLDELHIGEKLFKQLLFAVMASVGGKKKIYVALDVPIAELPGKAKQLLTVLYASLPYEFRKQLGFITYAKEPQSRKSVHLTFVEQGSLRVGDRSIEKDFTFDFANDRMTNVDLEGTDQPYLDFAWDNLERGERAEQFYQFAELMLLNMDSERQVAVSSYHELAVMFQMEENNDKLYETHKSAVLRGMLDYLRPTGSLNLKMRLNDLFLSRFDYEYDRMRQGIIPETFIAESFKDYYHIDGKHNESKIIAFFMMSINCAKTQRKTDAVASFYAAIESNTALSQAFFAKILLDSKNAEIFFIPFIEEKMKQAAGVKSILQVIEQWTAVHPQLYNYGQFLELASEQLKDKLDREHRSMAAVNQTMLQLSKLKGEAGSGKKSGAAEALHFYQELELTTYRTFLSDFNLDKLTMAQLEQAVFLGAKDQLKRWNEHLKDSRRQSLALVLSALYDWLTLPEPNALLTYQLSPVEIDQMQEVGRRLLEGKLQLAHFERLTLVFRDSSDTEIVDYTALLDFLSNNSENKETAYRFFQWSEKHPDFMRSRGFVPAYASAIIAYFKKYDRDAFKKRANWKLYFDKTGPTLKAIYKQAKQELSSPAARFFRRNRKATVISSVTTLGVILVVAGVLMTLGDKEKPGGIVSVPEITPTDNSAVVKADTLVHVQQTSASEGVEAKTSLIFLFKDASACAAFKPESLTIKKPDKETLEYTGLYYAPACQDATAKASPTPSTPIEGGTQNNTTDTPAEQSESETESPTNSPTDTGLDTSVGNGAGNDANAEQDLYTSKVIVALGKQVELPLNSIVLVGETEYTITEP